ncbi:MAG TPA: nuclease-related domain-containing protein [Herpetosiphonaceae bacterium]|nr:nuclease-related domain-containing protein [Herpetosiphonaceae bacterium]
MAVQVWIGEKPENPNERKAIIALASGLDRLDGLYIMLANFSVGGHTIDLVILKRDAIFILELKHCDGRVYGAVNGPWTVVSRGGSTKQLNPGRKNPYNQVISYFYSFTNFLNDHKAEIVSTQKAPDVDFRSAKRVVVVVPTLEPGSEVELDWKVQVKGLDELPTYLVVERSAGLDLSDQALMRIPKLLRCTPWQELNDLIAGVLPPWEATPSDPPEPAVVAPNEPAEPIIPEPRPRSMRTRVQGWLAGAVTVFAVGTLIYAIAVRPPAPTDPGRLMADASITAAPMPTIPEGGVAPNLNNGVAELHQWVGRRWDEVGSRWFWERAEDADVLVTLETVDFNGGAIRLTWTVENRRQNTISMPMTESNFEITDGTLEYRIDQRRSEPVELKVKPGAKETVTVIVTEPVRPSAQTLQVTILEYPFGKTTWLVPVPVPLGEQ